MADQLLRVRNKKLGIEDPRDWRNASKLKDEPVHESHYIYLAAMKFFDGRDFKQEKKNIKEEVE